MATQKAEPKKAKKDAPTAIAKAGNGKPAAATPFFEEAKRRFAARPRPDGMVLLNIPVWGWTGDGKTCALLTLLQYAEAPRHGLSLNLVTDRDEITKLEEEVEAYQGRSLHAVAESTKARLGDLSDTFINDAEWPPGTDEPSPYLFAIRSIKSTLAYLVVPDIPGGSFREVDDVARTILGKAHACVVLVQPERYRAQDPDGKRYRDEVMTRITRCAEVGIPACVMITKADKYHEQNSVADETQNELTIVIQSQEALTAEIFRVSVIGTEESLTEDGETKLPKAGERHPDQLIQAFVWVIDQALKRPVPEIRTKVPDLELRRVQLEPQVASEAIPELRKLGDFSDRPGLALCSISPDTVLFIAPDGALVAATFREGGFATKAAGTIAGVGTPTSRFVGLHTAGELVIAPGQKTDAVWLGPMGDKLVRTALPFAVVSWSPVTARSMLALDASGRLHSLRYESGKWIQVDYIADFIPATERLIVSFVDTSHDVIALNGSKAEAIRLHAEGKFGDRRRPNVVATYDSDRYALNRLGIFAGTNAQMEMFASNGAKLHNLGPSRRETQASFAIASAGRYIAKLGPDLRLSVALVNGETVSASEAEYSPVLPKDPDSMVWSSDGQLLVVTFPDGTYAAFKPSGLRA